MRRLVASAAAVAMLALASGPAAAEGQTYTWSNSDYLAAGLPSSLTSVDTLNITGFTGLPDNVMHGVTLENQGVVNWRRNSIGLDGSTINNAGLWNATSSSSMSQLLGARSVFNNTGVFRATNTGDFASTTINMDFTNSGTVDVQGGILLLGGNSDFQDGTQLTGTGTGSVIVAGNANFSGRIHSDNLYIVSSTSTGNDARLEGTTSRFEGGTLTGTWEIASGHQMMVIGAAQQSLTNATLTNSGTVTLQGAASLKTSNGNIVNQGRFELQGDGSVRYGGSPWVSTFTNQGLLVKSGGTGVSDFSQLYFSNTGTVDVRSGTLRLPDEIYNFGVMQGVGTIASKQIHNYGRMKPGEDGVGTLTLDGNFSNESFIGIVDIGLGNAGSHALLSITGDAALAGELALSCVGDCSFAVGEQFEVLHYAGTRSGTFESLTLNGFGTGAFTTLYDDVNHSVELLVTEAVTAAVPEPDAWLLWAGGLGLVGLLARRRRA